MGRVLKVLVARHDGRNSGQSHARFALGSAAEVTLAVAAVARRFREILASLRLFAVLAVIVVVEGKARVTAAPFVPEHILNGSPPILFHGLTLSAGPKLSWPGICKVVGTA